MTAVARVADLLKRGQRMSDTSHSLIIWILAGAIAGGIASFAWRGRPYGILKDIFLGILGACMAYGLDLTIPNSIFLDIVVSTAGALVVLVVIRLYRSN
jgi:uncharacterized membrane protein YeaQ/YmgE (transglycosylase-associated protein family)